MKRQLAYWKTRLDGMTELDLPTDFPRPPVKTWKGEMISTLLPSWVGSETATLSLPSWS